MTLDLNGSGRTPRIAIMGEFSAGKSTLCNLLMRTRALPERVTATRLAPVWMTRGPGQNIRMTTDGEAQPIDINALDSLPFEGTRYIRLYLEAEILDHCDFIDFPGISDPNMDAEAWESVLTEADAVLWLTHATQAWRQSEAAVWDTVPEDVRQLSLLLVTRFDKLTTESDQSRVLMRLERETQGLFHSVLPVSLTDALAAGDDYEAWSASGAADMMERLVDVISTLTLRSTSRADDTGAEAPVDTGVVDPDPAPVDTAQIAVSDVGPAKPVAPVEPSTPRIVPRRVKPSGTARRPRPEALRA